MAHDESDVDPDEIRRAPSPDPIYLHSYLSTHIASTSAHLCTPLPTSSHFKAFSLSRDELRELKWAKDEPLLGHTFYPPATYWSPSEKALFFRALASCSRLRPDLIAERIRTKTTAEVEACISLLDSALQSTPEEELLPRAKFPLAHEAPQELIEYEESQAAMCMEYEAEYAEEMVAETRREEEREWRKEKGIGTRVGRPKKGGTRETAQEKRDREMEKEHRADIAEWRAEREPFWEAEDALRNMDIVQLGALDRLIKRGERQGPLDNVEAEDGVIVPDLLPGQRATSDPRGSQQPSAGQSEEDAVAGPSSQPSRPTTPAPASTSALATPSAVDDEEDPANLSPASKSRLRKRLWMRRKRAAARGEVADMSRTLLKPGKKAKGASVKTKKGSKGKGKIEADSDDDGEEDEDEDEEAADAEDDLDGDGEEKEKEELGGAKKRSWAERRKKGHRGGQTRPYKFESTLLSVGLDGAALRERGLGGLLSYGGLGKLSRIYTSLEFTSHNSPPKFSGEFLRYLEALVRVFARRVIGMAIRVRELDFALKGHTKVWRLGKRRMVLKHHIARALTLVGPPRTDKKAYFTALAGRLGEDPDGGVGVENIADEEEDGEMADEDEADVDQAVEGDDEKDEEGGERERAQDDGAEDVDDVDIAKNGAAWVNRRGQLVQSFWPPRAFAVPYIATSHLPSIPITYPFGIDTPGTRPQLAPSEDAERATREAEAAEDLMESDAIELSREVKDEQRLNAIDEKKGERDGNRVMVALGLIAAPQPVSSRKKRVHKRALRAATEGSDSEVDEARPAKRTRRQGGFKALQSDKLAAADPDGVRIKSAAYIVDSDEDI
ncbi:unnamed protein product [Peniophora sp. CBMAI 1063]|nr:unnamed protein product [Peniophora sp. CBMAI 1063]